MLKRVVTATLIIGVLLSLAGCGGKEAKNAPAVEVKAGGATIEAGGTAPKVSVEAGGTSVKVDASGPQVSVTTPAKSSATPGAVTVGDGAFDADKGECKAGVLYGLPVQGGGQEGAKVIGLTPYKGKTYCKVELVSGTGNQQSKITYYFGLKENKDDVWMIMDIGGQVQELHVGGN